MSRIPQPKLPPSRDVEELRQHVQQALGDLARAASAAPVRVDLDMTEHRISNVAWPTEFHDAVNIEYLEAFIGSIRRRTRTAGSSGRGNEIIFNLAAGTTALAVGNNLAPPRVITDDGGMGLVEWVVQANIASTGADLVLRVTRNGSSYQVLTYPGGSTALLSVTTLTNTAVSYHDYFNVDVTGVGTGCKKVFIAGKYVFL